MIHFKNSAHPAAISYAAVQSDPARRAPRHMTPEEFIDEIATQVEDRLMWHSMALIGGLIAVSAVWGVVLAVVT